VNQRQDFKDGKAGGFYGEYSNLINFRKADKTGNLAVKVQLLNKADDVGPGTFLLPQGY